MGRDLPDRQRLCGWVGGLWRRPLLSKIERDVAPDLSLRDGICMSEEARGLGLGSALLGTIKVEAA
ncbi:hypothetical protein [uncultured Roseobacter sp.]|uniref:hypothetical protein n=1 Tax=uncultured Roseobacter sp. TaxID=114847 RepID=UPI00263134BA|nr:hypothetical protein [uncultured Roseobacter sp.]